MTRYCPKCGTAANDDDVLCQKCGYVLKPEEVSDADVIEVTEVVEETMETKQEAVPDEDSADVVVESILDNEVCGDEEEAQTTKEEAPIEALEAAEEASGFEKIKPEAENVGAFYENVDQRTPQYEASEKEVAPKIMSLGDWLITLILICIPIVNLVMLIYWSAANEIDPNKKNFARAQLIIMGIGVVLSFAFFGSIMAFLVAAFSGGYYY